MGEEATKLELTEKKAPMDIDISRGILPKSYNELLQFAALYHGSGLAPKSFQTVQQCAIAIGMCLELDRPILTGIQDMAVINGKVSIYGDAALAIVRRSGLLEFIKETEEGKPYTDTWKFTCILKRKGAPEQRVGIWTWEDAKRAGFDQPKTKDGRDDIWSPWTRFTRRMMQFKARNFVLRDEFGDVIKGMTLAEDAQDIIDVTPEPTRTLHVTEPPKAEGAKIYDIKGETKPEPQPTTESAATTAPEAKEQEKDPEPKKRSPKPKVKEPDPPKTQGPPPMVDFETGEVAQEEAPKEKTFTEKAVLILQELTPEARKGVLALYGIKTADWDLAVEAVGKLPPGYHEPFLSRASKQLDLQNAKNRGE